MGKYRHGPVHYRPKTWKAAKDNRKEHEARIDKNREIIRALSKDEGSSDK